MTRKRKKRNWPADYPATSRSFSDFVAVMLANRIADGKETYTGIALAAGISPEQVWRFLRTDTKLTLRNFDKLVRLAVVQFKLFEITSD